MFNTFIYNPLYNALVGILDIVPGGNVFVAVIILTIIVKTILYPLTKKSIITQIKSKALNEELKDIKKKNPRAV
jgi:YidC/Oxa1 family membrane protein insertase